MAEGKPGMSGWRIALNIVGAMMLVVFGSCAFCVYMVDQKKSERAARASRSAEPPQPPPPLVPQPPSGLSDTVSVANFTKDTRLDECDDFTVTVPPEVDGGEETLMKALDGLSQNILKGKKKGLSKIGRPCSEQFRTAHVLATCVVHQDVKGDSGTALSLDVAARYYNLDTLTSNDRYMKDCIDMQGDWQAVEKDSDEYREALHARTRRQMEGLVDKAEKMQKDLGQ